MPGSAIGTTFFGSTVLEGGQVDVGDIGTLVAQKARDLEVGIGGRNTAVDQRLIGSGGIGVPQAVVGHGAGGVRVLNFTSDGANKLLEAVDGDVGGNIIGNKQLVAPWRDGQHFRQLNADAFVDGHAPNFAALAFDDDGLGAEGVFCRCRVQSEALMDTESGVIGQGGHGGVVLVAGFPALAEELAKLPLAPGAIYAAEAAALQFDGQVAVVREGVLGVYLVVEETDGRQIGLDGGRRFALGL